MLLNEPCLELMVETQRWRAVLAGEIGSGLLYAEQCVCVSRAGNSLRAV